MARNGWPDKIGMGGRFTSEWVAGMARNTHSQAITIVDALRESLNLDEGGDLAENLWLLYEYVAKRLVVANSKNSTEMLDECHTLLGQVQEAWNQIPAELHAASQQELRTYAVAQ